MTKTATTMAAALAMAGIAAALGAAEPNTLTAAEKAAGWQLLWDGKTLNGWVGEKGGCKAPPAKGWKIEDGILTVLPTSRITQSGKWEKLPKEQAALGGGGDLVTKESFKDFELVASPAPQTAASSTSTTRTSSAARARSTRSSTQNTPTPNADATETAAWRLSTT